MLRWRNKVEEFSPILHYIEGPKNILADNLSRLHRLPTPAQLAEGKNLIEPASDNDDVEEGQQGLGGLVTRSGKTYNTFYSEALYGVTAIADVSEPNDHPTLIKGKKYEISQIPIPKGIKDALSSPYSKEWGKARYEKT